MLKQLSGPLFWTWDHSTNWKKNEHGKQVAGCNNNYTKSPEAFIEDYKRLILWASQNGISAVGVAGLLRDSHGGVASARKVADFAAEHDIVLYEIAGLAAYNGIYYSGNNEWCLNNFLAENPECQAVDENGKPVIVHGPKFIRHACWSKQKMRDYCLRSMEWLFTQIPTLGGISIEAGDSGICQCEECKKRRALEEEELSTEDMAYIYPQAVESIRSVKPDALIICEIYEHFLPHKSKTPGQHPFGWGINEVQAKALSAIPKDVYMSWVADYIMHADLWKETDQLPEPLKDHHHIMRAHWGTQWHFSTRHMLELENIRKTCYLSKKAGMDNVSFFGESSVYNTNNELNYLAEVYFAKDPFRSVEDFLKDVAAELLGGSEAAYIYYTINERIADKTLSQKDIDTAIKFAASLQGEQRRRWIWLSSYIASIHWDNTELI